MSNYKCSITIPTYLSFRDLLWRWGWSQEPKLEEIWSETVPSVHVRTAGLMHPWTHSNCGYLHYTCTCQNKKYCSKARESPQWAYLEAVEADGFCETENQFSLRVWLTVRPTFCFEWPHIHVYEHHKFNLGYYKKREQEFGGMGEEGQI